MLFQKIQILRFAMFSTFVAPLNSQIYKHKNCLQYDFVYLIDIFISLVCHDSGVKRKLVAKTLRHKSVKP